MLTLEGADFDGDERVSSLLIPELTLVTGAPAEYVTIERERTNMPQSCCKLANTSEARNFLRIRVYETRAHRVGRAAELTAIVGTPAPDFARRIDGAGEGVIDAARRFRIATRRQAREWDRCEPRQRVRRIRARADVVRPGLPRL